MIHGFSAAAVRAAETPLLEAGDPLMLRAAHALAEQVTGRLRREHASPSATRVLVLAGPGANGGDGLHAAALLRRSGVQADAIATARRRHEEGARALLAAGGTITPLGECGAGDLAELVAGADLVCDAILGIGARPEIPEDVVPLLDAVRERGCPVVAVDVPSFLDVGTGQSAPGALRAEETITFGAVKAGLLLPDGAELAGSIRCVELGLGPSLRSAGEEPAVVRLEDAEVRAWWPTPAREASKYSRGVVALAAGSSRFPGAAVLACSGAARAGAGMVRCLAPQPVIDHVLHARPEVIGHPGDEVDPDRIGRTHALVIGPGLPDDDPRVRAGIELLRTGRPIRAVLDAGALDALGPQDRLGPDTVLTPHRGEAERLAGRLGADAELPAAALARALAEATGATVLLKGAVTVIAPGDGGPLYAQDDATSQLATAGTGDVLAGVLGTLLAAGVPGPRAAALAALVHGRAGRLASADGVMPLVALDVADHLPAALATILTGGRP